MATPPKIGFTMKIWARVLPAPASHSASITSAWSSIPRPAPPCSSGSAMPPKPALQIACHIALG